MKKPLLAIVLLLLLFCIVPSCSKEEEPENTDPNTVVIGEKFFVTQTNDIYINYRSYLGKTIVYEGLFTESRDIWGRTSRFVIRYGPGCCGYDQNAGFEVVWDGEWPNPEDWVAVEGVLGVYEGSGTYGWPHLYLYVTSMEVQSKRGQLYVVR